MHIRQRNAKLWRSSKLRRNATYMAYIITFPTVPQYTEESNMRGRTTKIWCRLLDLDMITMKSIAVRICKLNVCLRHRSERGR